MARLNIAERRLPQDGRIQLKVAGREVDVRAKWIGFEIPDKFVVGYGIDYAQRNRNLPHIGAVRFSDSSGAPAAKMARKSSFWRSSMTSSMSGRAEAMAASLSPN